MCALCKLFSVCIQLCHEAILPLVKGSFAFRYYEATIEDITEDGEEVSVVFDNYKNSDVTTLAQLRELKSGVKRSADDVADSKSK
jgi:hypothetical protein